MNNAYLNIDVALVAFPIHNIFRKLLTPRTNALKAFQNIYRLFAFIVILDLPEIIY